jgi:hypothetical protein
MQVFELLSCRPGKFHLHSPHSNGPGNLTSKPLHSRQVTTLKISFVVQVLRTTGANPEKKTIDRLSRRENRPHHSHDGRSRNDARKSHSTQPAGTHDLRVIPSASTGTQDTMPAPAFLGPEPTSACCRRTSTSLRSPYACTLWATSRRGR